MRRRDGRGQIDLPEPAEGYRELVGGRLCLELANTVDEHGENKTYDYLFPGYGNLVSWSVHVSLIDENIAGQLMREARRQPREAVQVRRRAVALREAIFTLATGAATDQDIQTIDDEWAVASPHRRLNLAHDRLQWTWTDVLLLDRVLWPIVQSAIDLVTGDEIDRVRQCESPTCQWLFLDTTRNGNRRFCRSQGCGNRTRVRRFREGQRENGANPS